MHSTDTMAARRMLILALLAYLTLALAQNYEYPDLDEEEEEEGGRGGGGGGAGGYGGSFDAYGQQEQRYASRQQGARAYENTRSESSVWDEEDEEPERRGGGSASGYRDTDTDAARDASGQRRRGGPCPRGCECEPNSEDGCRLRVTCTLGKQPTPAFSKDMDCLSLAQPSLAQLSLQDKAAVFHALPAGLKSLDLGMSRLGQLPEDMFANLTALRFLSMEYNNLVTLPEKLFDGLSKLKIMYLTGNHYESDEPEYKQRLTAGNNIKEIHRNQFKDLTALQVLLMHHNKISALHEDTFRNNKKLKVLKLLDNKLPASLTRSSPVFAPLKDITQLDLLEDSGDSLEDQWEAAGTTLKDEL